MKQAVVVQHVAFEDLGLLAPLLRQRGYRSTVYRPPQDEVWPIDPAHLDLLVLLGGPMSVNDAARLPWLADEIALAQVALARAIPVLGLCLGAQVLAVAAGGTVAPMAAKEIGLAPLRLTAAGHDSVLAALAETAPLLHWHGEAIALPPSLPSLAQTPACAVQAFQPGPCALGLQFHPEADLRRLRDWTEGHAAEVAEAGIDTEGLLARAGAAAETAAAAGTRLLAHWLDSLPR